MDIVVYTDPRTPTCSSQAPVIKIPDMDDSKLSLRDSFRVGPVIYKINVFTRLYKFDRWGRKYRQGNGLAADTELLHGWSLGVDRVRGLDHTWAGHLIRDKAKVLVAICRSEDEVILHGLDAAVVLGWHCD